MRTARTGVPFPVEFEVFLALVKCTTALQHPSSSVQWKEVSHLHGLKRPQPQADSHSYESAPPVRLMIYLSTAIGLTPGGSSTVHIYTHTHTHTHTPAIEQHK